MSLYELSVRRGVAEVTDDVMVRKRGTVTQCSESIHRGEATCDRPVFNVQGWGVAKTLDRRVAPSNSVTEKNVVLYAVNAFRKWTERR